MKFVKLKVKEPFYGLMYKASEGWNDHLFQVPPELIEQFGKLIIQTCIKKLDEKCLDPSENEANARTRDHIQDLETYFKLGDNNGNS